MQAFILAGGFATRLWPLTEKRAKPLLPLAGKPMLSHLVEKIPEMPITVSTNAVFAEDFEEWKREESGQRSAVSILIEDAGHEGEKLGALGAVSKWIQEEKINDDVLLLAGDNYVGFSIKEFLKNYSGNPLLAAHDIGSAEKAKAFGTVITEGKTVKAFEEKPENPQSTLISTGVYVLPKNTLSELVYYAGEHPDNIGGIFEHFLSKGLTVDCVSFSEPWFDIGSFDAYLEATATLVGEDVLLAEATTLENTDRTGSVVIGKGSDVRKSTLTNVVTFENCIIDDCVLEDCVIDDGCELRGVDLTGKMLREKTHLISRQK